MMKTIHSYWAYLVLIALVLAVVNAIIGFIQKKEYSHKDFRLGLITLILTHIQFLIGLGWYFMSPWYKTLKSDTAIAMKNSGVRLLALEHPITMLIAIVFITIGWSKHKKKVKSESKFKMFMIFYGIALLLVISRIPWTNWFN